MEIKQLIRPGLQDEYGILKLQNIILNIMKYIDDLCQKHQIEYYIIGGTALGAIRHGGFIPWDDDLDIAMTRENYDKFIEICDKEIDKDNFFLQVGRRDWPLYYSKLRLKGTLFDEEGAGEEIAQDNRGIFVDIFPFDNASDCMWVRCWQYFCGRLLIAQALSERNYTSNSLIRKIAMYMSGPLGYRKIREYLYHQIVKYNKYSTGFVGDFFDSYRLKDASWPSNIWATPQRVCFETIELNAPSNIERYLKDYFHNYMVLPPEEKRKPLHIDNINYGIYS